MTHTVKRTPEHKAGPTPGTVVDASALTMTTPDTIEVNGHRVGKHSWLTLDIRTVVPATPAPRGWLRTAAAFLTGRTALTATHLLVQVEAVDEHRLIARISQPRRERNQLVELGLSAGTNPYITGVVHR